MGAEYEFIEIQNSLSRPVDLSSYQLDGDIYFTFPDNTIIDAESFIIIAKDQNQFLELSCLVLEWDSGELANQEGIVQLIDPQGLLIDEVQYNPAFPYYQEANGKGPSLTLLDSKLDNSLGENWISSTSENGLPCDQNYSYQPYEGENIHLHIYPNPSDGPLEISYAFNQSEAFQLRVFNTLGQLLWKENLKVEAYLKTRSLDIEHWGQGMYLFEIRNEKHSKLLKVIKN